MNAFPGGEAFIAAENLAENSGKKSKNFLPNPISLCYYV
jgi:hypothetical protein